MAAVTLDRVTKVHHGGVRAVDNVVLRAEDAELLVLPGPSGCGKTSILRMIAGLEEVTSGDILLDGQRANDLQPWERNVAMVFQDGALYPHLTARDNLAFPLLVSGPVDRSAVEARVAEMAYGLGIESTLDRRPALLSGGERQRVAMGRALIRGRPAVLLMDEPLASLDAGLCSELRAEIASLVRSLDLTTIYVTHDQVEALSIADRVAVLRSGTVEDVGSPAHIYNDPATAFAATFLGSPPINLAWAAVWVVNGHRVIVDFGTQRLELPWDDAFSEALTPYHGDRVIVGIRPESLTRSTASASGSLLRGKVSSIDYHGHEWLARLTVGFRPVELGPVAARPPDESVEPAHLAHYLLRFAIGTKSSQAVREVRGEHRAASLLLRLDSAHGWTVGDQVSVTVDVAHIYVFDTNGKRIGAKAQSFAEAVSADGPGPGIRP